MPSTEQTIVVDMNAADVFLIISDFEKYPDYMENVKHVSVLKKTDEQTTSQWTSELDGRIFKWTEMDTLIPAENRIEFELMEGDLKEYGGFWQLKETGEGTSVTLNVYLEIGVPMLAMFLNPIISRKLKENVEQMLSDIKNATLATRRTV